MESPLLVSLMCLLAVQVKLDEMTPDEADAVYVGMRTHALPETPGELLADIQTTLEQVRR